MVKTTEAMRDVTHSRLGYTFHSFDLNPALTVRAQARTALGLIYFYHN